MRTVFLADTHLGVRSNSKEWIDLQREYFFDWFIPTIKALDEELILIHCGDVFDNRQSLNLFVLNFGIELFEEFSKIFKEIHIIVGNHDIIQKSSNEINSLKFLRLLPNVHVYEEPERRIIAGAAFGFLPWRVSVDAERQAIKDLGQVDYLICHTDIRGLNFNKYVKIEEGIGVDQYGKIKRVYSGHIHWRQEQKNVLMLGSPYPMTRSDIGNDKYVTILDPVKAQEQHILNDHSPKFMKFDLEEIQEDYWDEFHDKIEGNFIDLIASDQLMTRHNINGFLEMILKVARSSQLKIKRALVEDVTKDVEVTQEFDIQQMTRQIIESHQGSIDQDLSQKIVDKIQKLYLLALQQT